MVAEVRRAKRTDRNQGPIVDALRAVGAHVVDTSAVGGGFPDLVVCFRGLYLIEVKNPQVSKKDQQLRKTQEKLHAQLATVGVTVHVVLTADDALRAIGAIQ